MSLSMAAYKRGRFDLFANKPEAGQAGQQIVILSNHFVVSYDCNKSIYSYYVNINQIGQHNHHHNHHHNNNNHKTFKNEQLFRSVIKRLIENNCQPGNIFNNIHCIYDGASCMFTTERLPIIEDKMVKFRVTLPNKEIYTNEFEVCIKMVKLVSYQSIKDFYQNPVNDAHIEAIRSINLVVRHLFMNTRFLVGRSSFHLSSDQDERSSISSLKEISYGIFSSVQGCLSGLQLILDRSCTPFMKPLSIDEAIRIFLKECGNQRWNETNKKRMENIIRDYYFEVTNLQRSRRYKIGGLTLEPATKVMFTSNDQTISVAEYFRKTYFPLRWPDLPCVKVKRSRNDFIYFPAEVCKIVPDQKTKKLTTKEKADLIRNAASVNPSERFDVIQASAFELIESDRKHNYLREFGVNIATQPVAVKARVLEVPKLLEGDNKEVKPVNGKWRINKFFKAVNLSRWILILMARLDDSTIDRFLDTLIRHGEQLGMEIKHPVKIHYNFDIKDISNFFHKLKQSYSDNIDLFLFLGCDSEIQYNAIKKCGDIDFSVPTQCMRQTNVFRFNQSIAVNVLQKINTKLGGINVGLDCEKMPLFLKDNCNNTLVVGVDVAHPSPTEKNCPSVAALVGNSDGTFTQYTSSVKIQKFFRQEIIQELDQMLLEVLKTYENNTGKLPDRIIFYRDGVSEGQFRVVYDEEVHLIKESLAKFRPGYKVKLTFVIVQKRHHTRFLPDNSKDGVGKNCNVPPGTVVDTHVVHPRHFDFYLCSHAGIQGTSRPSHYCVLIDENDMTADQIQDLTNVLCHLYARCSRSISIPTPVFYAHLAAFRARAHTQASTYLFSMVDHDNKMKMDYFSGNSGNNSNNGGGMGGNCGNGGSRIHYTKHRVPCLDNFDNYIEMTPKMRSSMYFC